ncbi:hypothetical protein [Gluconobacter cerinus]|uniref:hypothetical protein n=1 Tax=Gluconobacter cerinus TaxID=38307 RepID=UPI001B8C1DDF|nr:hypothetical protein [Gluconobacter cerinus]MBS1068825.1 hypothetical protein [Gluconobacter cerinus]
MSILHTLKRKLRSCRRQQDAVSASEADFGYRPFRPVYPEDLVTVPPKPEESQPAQKVELEPWVLAALERMESIGAAERLWKTKPTNDEINTFRWKYTKEQIEILNVLLLRVNILRGNISSGLGQSGINIVVCRNNIHMECQLEKDGSE